MSDDVLPSPSPAPRSGRSFVRRWVYPVLVILAIVAVIYYLDTRGGDATDSSGQAYGIREMNRTLNPNNLDVEAAEGALADRDDQDRRQADAIEQRIARHQFRTTDPCRKRFLSFRTTLARRRRPRAGDACRWRSQRQARGDRKKAPCRLNRVAPVPAA